MTLSVKLGGNWSATVGLWLVGLLTMKECIGAQRHSCRTTATSEVPRNCLGSQLALWRVNNGGQAD